MYDDLPDRIYEAAFVPDLWPNALEGLMDASGSASGTLMVFTAPDVPPILRSAGALADSVRSFANGDAMAASGRGQMTFDERFLALGSSQFFCSFDHITDPEDVLHKLLRELGIGTQQVTFVPLPTGEVAVFHFERWMKLGSHEDHHLKALADHRPHLARAALVSARLRFERARAAVSALKALGIPAAVTRRGGQVLATNDLIERTGTPFRSAAFERLSLSGRVADKLLDAALRSPMTEFVIRSIPVPATEAYRATVIHVIPLVRSAQDVFLSGDMLVVASELGASTAAPSVDMLTVLFDLTPSEARLASLLVAGKPISKAAAELDVTVKSARTYLDRLFIKTGTHRQTELIALLRGAAPIR